MFDVVYFWTGFEGLKQQIERMHERIKLYDQMLGRPFEANLWPCMEGQGPEERMYKGESKSFIHRESSSLAEAWHTTIQTEQGLAERQQISLFHWMALRTGSALGAEAVATGQLKLEDVEASIHEIRKLALYAKVTTARRWQNSRCETTTDQTQAIGWARTGLRRLQASGV